MRKCLKVQRCSQQTKRTNHRSTLTKTKLNILLGGATAILWGSVAPFYFCYTLLGWDPLAFAREPGERFRDCTVCPEMVVIPGSQVFFEGDETDGLDSKEGTDIPEHSHQVNFAMSIFEITLSEWKNCASEGGCISDARNQSEGGAEFGWREWKRTLPVAGVSWTDSQQYTLWLSAKTGEAYRLPTESEWQYAAKGGVKGDHYWEGQGGKSCDYANLKDRSDCDDGYKLTAPVGSYYANAFGLYDMMGNVAEWVEGCWNSGSETVEFDGATASPSLTAATISPLEKNGDANCIVKVHRGGHWDSDFEQGSSANRVGLQMDTKSDNIGFRIVRTLR